MQINEDAMDDNEEQIFLITSGFLTKIFSPNHGAAVTVRGENTGLTTLEFPLAGYWDVEEKWNQFLKTWEVLMWRL